MSKALIIVDVQNDFCEKGSLAVPGSNEIFAPINALKKRKDLFSHVILTRDWHPPKHVSFASTHQLQAFTTIAIDGKQQQLWPDHCVAGTNGAQLSPLLQTDPSDIIINKGIFPNLDSYSGFNWHNQTSQLKTLLENCSIKEVYVVGLAFDFCVGSTALDAQRCGFKTFVIEEATRSVSGTSEEVMRQRLKENGVEIISVSQISQE